VYDLVSWKLLHACSLAIPFLKRLFLIKWVNDLLPFQHQQHKYRQSPWASCPSSCGCRDEDWSHFLRCTHSHRCQAWAVFKPTLSPLFEHHDIDPSLCRLLLHGVFLVVTPDDTPLALDHLPSEHALLLANQELLGPDSLFFGFLTAEWASLQTKYLLFRGLPNQQHEAVTGIKAMVTALLSQVHSLWLLRNEHLHGIDRRSRHTVVLVRPPPGPEH
jgi:hypothetical protein